MNRRRSGLPALFPSANPAALEALRAGKKTYPAGAELVVSFYEVKGEGAMIEQGRSWTRP